MFVAYGISLLEFGRIMHACTECDQYIFVDSTRMQKHDCMGECQDISMADFSIMLAIFRRGCSGLTVEEIEAVFFVCDTCRHVYMRWYHTLHDCTDMGLVGNHVGRAELEEDYEEQ